MKIMKKSLCMLLVVAMLFSILIGTAVSSSAAAFTIQRQWDSKWKSYYVGGRTMYDTACGIFSMVNAIGYLTGDAPDVYQAAKWANSIGAFNAGFGGTDRSALYPKIQKKYGATYGFTCDVAGGSGYWANIAVLIIYIVWNALPFKILILLGGLQSVNKQYYDAARIDGATKSTILWKITTPLISPIISYLLITGIMGGMKGNPNNKNVSISNCAIIDTDVEAEVNSTYTNISAYAAGVLGFMENANTSNIPKVKISNCYSNAYVTSSHQNNSGVSNVYGIAFNGTITTSNKNIVTTIDRTIYLPFEYGNYSFQVVSKENGTTFSSPNCSSIFVKSMDLLSIRAGVPVLKR